MSHETVPDRHEQLTLDARSEDIDGRVKIGGAMAYHLSGTASIGESYPLFRENDWRRQFRVVDASGDARAIDRSPSGCCVGYR